MRLSKTAVALILSLFAFPSLAAITGTVMTGEGQPVAGARVLIHATESPAQRRERLLSASPQLPALAETKTDAKGAFSLPSPKEPVVDLRIEMRGFEPESRRVEKDEEAGAIAITAREMKSGTITAGGKPVANATVVINYSGAEWTVRTGADGKYEAPDLRRARSISVLHPDFAIDDENFFTAMTGGSSVPASKLTRTLTAGAPLSGKVVTPDGKSPVAKAVIAVDGWPVATSADDGSFVIAHGPAKWNLITAKKDQLSGQVTAKPLNIRTERIGTVSGRVLDVKTKVPVPGAMVRINSMRRGGAMFVDTTLMSITDAKGVYSITAAPGSYLAFVTHPGYDMQNGDVTITAGGTVTRDMNVTQLARVSGVVVDDEKRSVAGAKITAENASNEMGMPMMLMQGGGASTTTGADGRFALRIRSDADLRLRAAKKGLPQAKSDTIKLQSGERKSGIVLTIASGVAVNGRVLDASGQPLSGVSVVATETPANERGMMIRRMVMFGANQDDDDVVRTASDGTFTTRLKEGTYDFTFKREGFAPKSVRAQNVAINGTQPIETRLDPAAEISGRVTRGGVGVPDVMVNAFMDTMAVAMTGPDGSFTLTGLAAGTTRVAFRKEDAMINEQRSFTAPARDVNVELPLGGTIRGRVVEKGTTKAVTNFQAGVSASRSGGGMMMMGPPLLKSFQTDDGTFVLENVPSGAMNLVATAAGYSAARLNVDVEEGKTLNDVVLELEQGVHLTGRVTGPNGSPLSDVTVGVQPSATGMFAMTGNLRRATTDANGEYSLEGLSPGEETIEFMHAKYNRVSKAVTLKGREVKLDVALEGGSAVTGIVVTEGGAPVAEADVAAFGAGGGGHTARTNASGAFEMDGLRPGRYRFTAAKNGFVEGSQNDVDISAGTPIRIVMQTGGTIYGRVTGVSESDMANVTVNARGGRASSSAVVDPQGNYRLEGAPIGTVSVSAYVQGRDFAGRRTSATQTVEVAAGSSQQVNIEFRGDVVIKGRITRNGQALGGANVSFFPRRSGGGANASVSADEGGMYSVAGLEDGEYSVSVTDMQRFSPYNTTYNVRGSATFDIDFKAASLRGRVIDAGTSEPVENANVQFRSTTTGVEFRGIRTALTDSAGNFSIDFVNPGSYQVTASRDGYGNVTQDVTFGESGLDNLELKLSRNDGVALTVLDARDNRTLGAAVIVFDGQGRIAYDSRATMRFGDAAREIRLPIAPGSYTATIMAPDYAPQSVNITSPSTPTVRVTPGGTILVRSKHNERRRMRLLDGNGVPYPRWTAVPMPRDLPPGTATLEHIAPGLYTLVLLNDDDSPGVSERVTVREGETATVDL